MKLCKTALSIFFVLIIFSCNKNNQSSNKPKNNMGVSNRSNIMLKCYPSTLYKNDTLVIEITLPHPSELAIMDPDSLWFDLQWEELLTSPSISHEKFENINRLNIVPTQTKGIRWINGREERSLIFSKAGSYTVFLGDNLETELENAVVFQDSVYYINKVKEH